MSDNRTIETPVPLVVDFLDACKALEQIRKEGLPWERRRPYYIYLADAADALEAHWRDALDRDGPSTENEQ